MSIGFVVGLVSCASLQRTLLSPPAIQGANFVGNKACIECHGDYTRAFPASPHARLHLEQAPRGDSAGCESCHGPGSLHVNAGGGRRFIINPGRDPQACFNCHVDVHAQFKLPNRHPVLENRMNCVQCHDPHGADVLKGSHRTVFGARAASGMARLNESCAECHRAQTRPVIYEHEALREGCTVCHQPHGSIADKLLIQRDNNLCLKCHAQVHSPNGELFIGDIPHTTLVNRGACWSAGCHTAVHGSNIDRRLRH